MRGGVKAQAESDGNVTTGDLDPGLALEGLHIGVRADPETWRSLDSRGNVNDGVALSLKITNRGTRVSHLIE